MLERTGALHPAGLQSLLKRAHAWGGGEGGTPVRRRASSPAPAALTCAAELLGLLRHHVLDAAAVGEAGVLVVGLEGLAGAVGFLRGLALLAVCGRAGVAALGVAAPGQRAVRLPLFITSMASGRRSSTSTNRVLAALRAEWSGARETKERASVPAPGGKGNPRVHPGPRFTRQCCGHGASGSGGEGVAPRPRSHK